MPSSLHSTRCSRSCRSSAKQRLSNVQTTALKRTGLRCFKTVGRFDVTSSSSAPCGVACIRLRGCEPALLESSLLGRSQLLGSLNTTGRTRLLSSSTNHRLSNAQARLRKARSLVSAQLLDGADACRFANACACRTQIRGRRAKSTALQRSRLISSELGSSIGRTSSSKASAGSCKIRRRRRSRALRQSARLVGAKLPSSSLSCCAANQPGPLRHQRLRGAHGAHARSARHKWLKCPHARAVVHPLQLTDLALQERRSSTDPAHAASGRCIWGQVAKRCPVIHAAQLRSLLLEIRVCSSRTTGLKSLTNKGRVCPCGLSIVDAAQHGRLLLHCRLRRANLIERACLRDERLSRCCAARALRNLLGAYCSSLKRRPVCPRVLSSLRVCLLLQWRQFSNRRQVVRLVRRGRDIKRGIDLIVNSLLHPPRRFR